MRPNSQQKSSLPCKCVRVVTVVVGAIVRVIAIFDSMLKYTLFEKMASKFLNSLVLVPDSIAILKRQKIRWNTERRQSMPLDLFNVQSKLDPIRL